MKNIKIEITPLQVVFLAILTLALIYIVACCAMGPVPLYD